MSKSKKRILAEKLEKAHKTFVLHFGYCPAYPNEIDFDQLAYADDLMKSVADNFDYTVEKYGTKVPKRNATSKDHIRLMVMDRLNVRG